MGKRLLLIFFCSTNIILSQEKSIEDFLFKSEYEYLEHLSSPKSISVEDNEFGENGEKLFHLSNNYTVMYDNKGQIIKHLLHNKNSINPFKTTIYDSLNRITKLEII